MLRIHYLLIAVSLMWVTSAAAASLEVAPGGVASAVGDDYASVKSLTLTGAVDAADLDFISSKMVSLDELDLSGVTIASYNGAPIVANQTDFPADVLPAYCLSGLRAAKIILPETVTEIGDGALMGASITSIVIPAAVKRIGSNAFSNCNFITTVTVPPTVVEAGRGMFASCSSLESVNWGLPVIPDATFSSCSSLKEVVVTTPTESIGNDAFRGCGALASFHFSPSLETIGDMAFSHSGLTEADLSDCLLLQSVGNQSFGNCGALRSISFPAGLKTVGAGAFIDDVALTQVNFPTDATSVRPFTFKGVESLTDASGLIGENVDSIGAFAMTGMRDAVTLTIPPRVAYIGDNAFEGWLSLESVHAENILAVPSLGNDVWAGVAQSYIPLHVPQSLSADFLAAPQWNEFLIKLSSKGTIHDDMADEMSTPKLSARWDSPGVIIISSAADPIENVAVYDTAGRLLASRHGAGIKDMRIAVGDSGAGAYLISVSTPSASSVIKLGRH